MSEKRLFLRIESDSQGSLKVDNNHLDGRVVDLSENGFSFISDQLLEINPSKQVELTVKTKDSSLKILSQLRWVEKIAGRYKYGLCYLSDLNKDGEYRRYVRKLNEDKGSGYFIFEVTVYLKDVNVFGTGYFSRYFDWQGMAREEYFMTVKNYEQIMSAGVRMITKKAWVDYQNHSTVFDHIIMRIQNRNIKRFSFEMVFTYYHKDTGKLIATGGQILAFSNHLGKLIPIPEQILDVVLKHKAL